LKLEFEKNIRGSGYCGHCDKYYRIVPGVEHFCKKKKKGSGALNAGRGQKFLYMQSLAAPGSVQCCEKCNLLYKKSHKKCCGELSPSALSDDAKASIAADRGNSVDNGGTQPMVIGEDDLCCQ
jgi:hypothetical protein